MSSSTKNQNWFVYIVKCCDASLYTGITTDIDRRLHEHNHLKKGAKYTRARRPIQLIYLETYDSRSNASKREAEIKKMSPKQKHTLILDYVPSKDEVNC